MLEKIRGLFHLSKKQTEPEIQLKQALTLTESQNSLIDKLNQKPVETPKPVIPETHDRFPYHQAKDTIIKQTKLQHGEGLEDQELAPISFSREEDVSKIKFELAEEDNILGLLTIILQTIGDAKITSWGNSIHLSKEDGLTVWLGPGIFSHLHTTIEFITRKDLEAQEIEAIINAYKLTNPASERGPKPKKVLESLGATIFNPEDAPAWDYLAGYEVAKQQIKETIILPFQHPEIYDQIAQMTRKNYESNRPKAILFEGPPGTGKTTMARIIAGEVEATLVYVPIESIMTKWYGESERNLAKIFTACQELGASLLFLDEIDSLATTREGNIHEATRRVLSVLLRKIDGFNPNEKTILIGATNRKNDLDPALLSRFDTNINFPLPNINERQAIFRNYAQHLSEEGLTTLAEKGNSLSGRDIKNLCERVERSWASELIARKSELAETPPLDNYLAWVEKNNT